MVMKLAEEVCVQWYAWRLPHDYSPDEIFGCGVQCRWNIAVQSGCSNAQKMWRIQMKNRSITWSIRMWGDGSGGHSVSNGSLIGFCQIWGEHSQIGWKQFRGIPMSVRLNFSRRPATGPLKTNHRFIESSFVEEEYLPDTTFSRKPTTDPLMTNHRTMENSFMG